MASTEITLDAANAMKGVTMSVRFKAIEMLKFRVRAGVRLLRLAAVVMGCNIYFELEP